jgi:hypothetical protein
MNINENNIKLKAIVYFMCLFYYWSSCVLNLFDFKKKINARFVFLIMTTSF